MTASEFKRLRQRLGTQQEVADALGVSFSQIGHLEAGRREVRPLYAYALRWIEHQQHSGDASRPATDETS